MKDTHWILIGDSIATSGTIISIAATAINNLMLDHSLAMLIWGL